MEVLTVFYGLDDLIIRISIPQFDRAVPVNTIRIKLSSPAYTSKVLVGLLKKEYETRIYQSNGFTTDISSYKYRRVLKQF